ncbi:acylphosphatase-2 isoform X3 [Gopherus flavomarginatus]|uniref:acylphosphatase-2 isoform X2 n=1 Tax=Gopherus evgoodei TaxID=1825980 RepID=UPI0011CF7D64|nr:acylphosphatase-2 isoform X2 [Gopherus evgoodei]XP_050807927.1 acylphosphatase-2 isoform X3 [Gopherus flavomarginatus]
MSALAKASGVLKSVDYEVFGRVQGVCFRMYTEDEARKMGVVGWVKNTRQGTVTGQVQGPEDKVNAIKNPRAGAGRREDKGRGKEKNKTQGMYRRPG